jgi:hypothetical protein
MEFISNFSFLKQQEENQLREEQGRTEYYIAIVITLKLPSSAFQKNLKIGLQGLLHAPIQYLSHLSIDYLYFLTINTVFDRD